MRKVLLTVFVIGLIILPLAVFGCKGKVQKESESATEPTAMTEEVVVTQPPVTEPSQSAVQEAIPPTAAVPAAPEAGKAVSADKLEHNKEIQTALKAANFYTGEIDGKIGPKTKRAVVEFQKAKGLKPDGRVGPKTWMELEKYLKQQ